MADSLDSRLGRIRHQALAQQVEDLPDPADATVSFLAQTIAFDSYPTVAACYYGVKTVLVNGLEGENDLATFASDVPDDGLTTALNIGTQVPPQGTTVICSSVGGRWVFRYDSRAIPDIAVSAKEDPSTTLNIKVCPGHYINASGCIGLYVGTASEAIPASSTRKVYLDGGASYALTIAASYPGSGYVPLATVTTDGTKILSVVDNRISFAAADSVPVH